MAFKKKRFRAPKIATVIGKGTWIEGNVGFSGGLHVDGVIKGNVMIACEVLEHLPHERAEVFMAEVRPDASKPTARADSVFERLSFVRDLYEWKHRNAKGYSCFTKERHVMGCFSGLFP